MFVAGYVYDDMKSIWVVGFRRSFGWRVFLEINLLTVTGGNFDTSSSRTNNPLEQ